MTSHNLFPTQASSVEEHNNEEKRKKKITILPQPREIRAVRQTLAKFHLSLCVSIDLCGKNQLILKKTAWVNGSGNGSLRQVAISAMEGISCCKSPA